MIITTCFVCPYCDLQFPARFRAEEAPKPGDGFDCSGCGKSSVFAAKKRRRPKGVSAFLYNALSSSLQPVRLVRRDSGS